MKNKLLLAYLACAALAASTLVAAPSVDFRHVIRRAYVEILEREPDPAGLENYNALMNGSAGLPFTEAMLRESLLRSDEYTRRHTPPSPPPPPPAGADMSLRVQGPIFVDSRGSEVELIGAVACCADKDADAPGTLEYGWPLVTEEFIDLVAAHRMNFVHARLGPMIGKEVNPDGEPRADVQGYALAPSGRQYDLDRWNDAYWIRLRTLVAHANGRGVYFQADIADTWVMEHGLSPWRAAHNAQGYDDGGLAAMRRAPSARHEAWIRKVVRELGGFSNVLWQDGNESFKGATPEWVFGMRDIVRDEESRNGYPHRPFGTNAQDESIERGVDYGIWHERQAPDPTTYPRLTNEYAEMTQAAVLEQVRIAHASVGVYFMYWRGDHSGALFLDTMRKIQAIIEGTDVPPQIPDACPNLVRWGAKIHNVMDSNSQLIEAPPGGWQSGMTLPAGSAVLVTDSTPRFGSRNGEPCNDEHPGCGGRKCEDPRGGEWTLEEAPADYRGGLFIQANGFQARVGKARSKNGPAVPMTPGHYRLRVRPRADCQDHYGKPVTVTRAAAEGTVIEWDVR